MNLKGNYDILLYYYVDYLNIYVCIVLWKRGIIEKFFVIKIYVELNFCVWEFFNKVKYKFFGKMKKIYYFIKFFLLFKDIDMFENKVYR